MEETNITENQNENNVINTIKFHINKTSENDVKQQIVSSLNSVKKYVYLEESSLAHIWSASSKKKCDLGWNKWTRNKLSNVEKRNIYYNLKLTILADIYSKLFMPIYNTCINNNLIVPDLHSQISSIIKRNVNLLIANIFIYSIYEEEVMNFKSREIFDLLFFYIINHLYLIIDDIIKVCIIKIQNYVISVINK